MKEYKNLIGGNYFSFGGPFETGSSFYDYKFSIDGANEFDIDMAVNFALDSKEKLSNLGYLGRKEILKKTAQSLSFEADEIEHAVKMMGMPIQYVRLYAQEVPALLSGYSDSLEQRYSVVNGKLARVHKDLNSLEIKEPLDGFVYSIVPSNDPRALSFVFSVVGTIGLPAVLKISKNELPIAHKIAREAIVQGYPADALNLLCWDTDDKKRAQELHFYMFSKHSPNFFIPFGNDDTINNQLRYKEKKIIDIRDLNKNIGKNLDELLISDVTKSDKVDILTGNVIRHTSGNCSIIVDGFSEKAVDLAGYSAFEYPISCKSAKSVYFVGSQKDFELFKIGLSNYAKRLIIGDPLREKTQVGFVDSDLLEQTLKKVEELRSLGQLEVVYGGEKISENQATPLIVTTDDHQSPFLTRETSIYMIALRRVDSLEQAVKECNLPGYKQRLAVSVISDKSEIESVNTLLDLNCDQFHVNQITRSLHPPLHQGINYLERMSRTISARLSAEMIDNISNSSKDTRKTYKVLFVDDQQDIAENIVEQMTMIYQDDKEFKQDARFEALVAYSGEKAVETIRRNPDIAVIVTDMRMGGMSGAKTIKEAKKVSQNIEGIILTAYAEGIDRQEAIDAGVLEYMMKSDYNNKPEALWEIIKKKLSSFNR